MNGRPWIPDEDAELRAGYGRRLDALAATLRRTVGAVYQRAVRLGLSRRRQSGMKRSRSILALHGKGHATAAIARRLKADVSLVRRVLRAAGKASNGKDSPQFRQHQRDLIAATRAAGRDPTAARWAKDKAESQKYGLPPLTRTALLIVLALTGGPLTRQDICERIGQPWKGSRKALRCRTGSGSHLANLMAAGLVAYQRQCGGGRARIAPRPGLYFLTPHAIDLLSNGGTRS